VTCDEYRRRWLDTSPRPATRRHAEWVTRGKGDAEGGGSGLYGRPFATSEETDDGWMLHSASCSACAAWEQSQRALDEVLANALLLAPPPELVARLARIPALAGQSNAVNPIQRLLELAFLVVVALGTIGVSGAVGTLVGGMIWPVLTDVLQALPVLLASPLISYAESVASTMLEALATLTLIALILLQLRPRILRDSITPSGRS
jgi:hypothetical protein